MCACVSRQMEGRWMNGNNRVGRWMSEGTDVWIRRQMDRWMDK